MEQININTLTAKTEFVRFFENEPLVLQNGETLSPVNVAYQTYGELNAECTNAILICHALTGNAHAAGICEQTENDPDSQENCLKKYSEMNYGKAGWWDELIGSGKAFDTDKYFVICSNILGSCYGTTGPASTDPLSGQAYRMRFPVVTVRDMVRVQYELIRHLGVNRIKTVAGGSLGGMQVLEWGIMYPELVESIIPIAAPAMHSDWAIALNEASRRAILNDPGWNNGNYAKQPSEGLELARMIAMISYRSDKSFKGKFRRERINADGRNLDPENLFQVQNYLNYQGKKLVKRFDASAYIYLANAMDLHDVSEGRGSVKDALEAIRCRALAIGISTDVLYTPDEQRELAELIPRGEYAEIESIYGHDAFLIEYGQMERMIKEFIV